MSSRVNIDRNRAFGQPPGPYNEDGVWQPYARGGPLGAQGPGGPGGAHPLPPMFQGGAPGGPPGMPGGMPSSPGQALQHSAMPDYGAPGGMVAGQSERGPVGTAIGAAGDAVRGIGGKLGGMVGWEDMEPQHKAWLLSQVLGAGAGVYGNYQAGRQADKERKRQEQLRQEQEERERELAMERTQAFAPFLGDMATRGSRRPG
jgi:hypothetical protein